MNDYTFFPENPDHGPLDALAHVPSDALTPVAQVVQRINAVGQILRLGAWSIVAKMEPTDFEALLVQLHGWLAQPLQRSSNVSAFEGSLAYHLGQRTERP